MDRWNLIEDIFNGALERPLEERVEYVADACGDDWDLRADIEALLLNEGSAAAELDALVVAELREIVRTSDTSEIGARVGSYRLVRELDSGGMGVVYLAMRSDDQYFQIVAIKMIRRGLETPALIQRFRTERQILATLTHPNIGTILDGGDTEDGRPFIAMEYVEGQPITSACDRRDLSTRERVELFRSVCSAVHYAHQKLIIHRDIKPSNVLVTPEGIVKLIDFGVSKPLYSDLVPSKFPETERGQKLLTPDYASPEQFLQQELTTASDIYSLGVLFYELLTGSRPYTLTGLSPADAERVVCSEEVRKPSSTKGLSERTRKDLRGDLDRIILMAMEKDPARRYLSAQHFEQDLNSYLSGRTVAARRTTLLYTLSKFVSRHRVATVMMASIIALSCGSIFIHRWQSRKADQRVHQVEALANSAIDGLAEKLEQSSGSTEIQASLFHGALDYLEQLRHDSGNDPRLLLQLSKAYERVGDLEGSPLVANLGNSGTAVASYQQALRVATEANARLPGAASVEAVIEAQQRLAGIEAFLENIRGARDDYEKSLTLAVDLWRQNPDDPVRKQLLARNYSGIGDVQLASLEPKDALVNFNQAFQVFGSEPNGDEQHDRTLIRLYLRRARALNELGSQSNVLADNRKAIAVAEQLTQKLPAATQAKRSLFSAEQNMVLVLSGRDMMNVGDSHSSQIYARKALAIAQAISAADPNNMQARSDVALGHTAMGDSFRLQRPAVAAEWYRKALAFMWELVPHYGSEARHSIAAIDEALAEVLPGTELARERLLLLQQANQIRRELAETSPHGRLHLMGSYCRLADAELDAGNLQQARQFLASALPYFDEFRPTSPSLLILRELGLCYESAGNVQLEVAKSRSFSEPERRTSGREAAQWYRRSDELWSDWNVRGVATPESEGRRRKVASDLERLKRFSF